jgi:hypothetical protein
MFKPIELPEAHWLSMLQFDARWVIEIPLIVPHGALPQWLAVLIRLLVPPRYLIRKPEVQPFPVTNAPPSAASTTGRAPGTVSIGMSVGTPDTRIECVSSDASM